MSLKENPRVLLVFPRPSTDMAAKLQGIARFQRMHARWSVFVDDDSMFGQVSDYLADQEWDGVICAHTSPAMAKMCLERGLPLVDLTDGPAFPGIPQVRPDNVAVGHMAAEDLAERGHKHFAYCGFSNDLWSNERRDGFVEGLALLGQTCAVMETMSPARYSPAWNARQVHQIAEWLQHRPSPLALLACHDQLAVQVLEAAKLCGRSVPEDLAVLGVNDDRASCEMSQPMLSSIALDANTAGFLAAEKLEQLMLGQSVVPEQLLVAPAAVVTRPSTDMLAIDDRRISAALRFIRENACRGITVEQVVIRVAAPRYELERGMRKHIGRSPQAEIRRIQVAEIKRLLLHTDHPLKAIAESTGFEYVEYMCVLFKRIVGETPGRYRKNVRVVSSPVTEDPMDVSLKRPEGLAVSAG